MRSAVAEANRGQSHAAEDLAWQAWNAGKLIPDAAVLASRMAQMQGEYSRSLRRLKEVEDQIVSMPVALAAEAREVQALDYEGLADLGNAERSYYQVLDVDPENVIALERLSKLLGACGRREEAIPYILRLVELGRPTDLLMLLSRESGAIRYEQQLLECQRKYPQDPFPLVGIANYAKEGEQIDEALRIVNDALSINEKYAPAHLLKIKTLADADRWQELSQIGAALPQPVQQMLEGFGSYWLSRGRMADSLGNELEAIRCFGEACRLQPESKMANTRLATLLARHGENDLSLRFAELVRIQQQLWSAQDRIIFTGVHERGEDYIELIDLYLKSQRNWEALGWTTWALSLSPNSMGLRQRFEQCVPLIHNAPYLLVNPKDHPIADLALDRFPLPTWNWSPRIESSPATPEATATQFAFVDQASEAGLDFEFCYGVDGEPQRYMYELTGGGVGVLDYDQDGWPDIALPQGRLWPVEGSHDPARTDILFRNAGGQALKRLDLPLHDDGFGQGVACGDFDNDGFCDIYVAQIGNNCLLKNMGDGTFDDITQQIGLIDNHWTVSCVLADLDGDSIPDLYDVNYLTATDLFERICQREGHAAQCSPFEFEGAPDAFWKGNGSGGFEKVAMQPPVGRGLGALAFNDSSSNGVSLFVTNDTDPNFLLSFPNQSDQPIEDRGIAAGVAFNEAGKAEGCMGIATADTDRDGRFDLYVTNFLSESNTLYHNQGNGSFQDRTKYSGLVEPSMNVLGFGTQFLDANLDGKLELIVANGHVDDLRFLDRPYKMRPQLYSATGSQYSVVGNAGDYFQKELLGRAVAKIDWNRDLRTDLVISQLQSPYTLLTNQSVTKSNAVAIQLVGTAASRDAVGAVVKLTEGDQSTTMQVTAGDGYACSNERVLVFPVVDPARAQLEISWPDGAVQSVDCPQLGTYLTVVESKL